MITTHDRRWSFSHGSTVVPSRWQPTGAHPQHMADLANTLLTTALETFLLVHLHLLSPFLFQIPLVRDSDVS